MAQSAPIIFDRRLLGLRRARAANRIGTSDFLLAHVADDLAGRLALVKRRFPVALNLGAHHGVLSRRVAGIAGIELLIDADPCPEMVTQCPGPRIVADEEFLPFRPRSLDLVLSALSLQHVNDMPGALTQIQRALKPDGLFLGALLGGSTLEELRQSLLIAESETVGGASPRVAPFADVRTLGGLLQRAGFALPVADSDTIEVGYASPLDLIADLRRMGATSCLVERGRSSLRRSTLARAIEVYAARFGRGDGRVRATFEVITLAGWSPDPSQPQPLRPGSAKTRLADALGVLEGGPPPRRGE